MQAHERVIPGHEAAKTRVPLYHTFQFMRHISTVNSKVMWGMKEFAEPDINSMRSAVLHRCLYSKYWIVTGKSESTRPAVCAKAVEPKL
jgi:hypothetical protein